MTAKIGEGDFEWTESVLEFSDRDGMVLAGKFFRPQGEGPFPTVIAIHGGGWRLASKDNYRHLGGFLAAKGYAVFAPTYRLATAEKPSFPGAVHDVRAAVQFLRSAAGDLGLDRERMALMGDSSGAHLAALVALAGDLPVFTEQSPNGKLDEWPTRVKAAVAVYGIFDLAAQWQHDQIARFNDHIVERFLGQALTVDRAPYFEASPLSYVSAKRKDTAFLVAWGDSDDVVDPRTQSEPFVLALKQAGHFVRTVPIQGAPHYWISDPLDEPGSLSAFFAARLHRFLTARL